MSAVPPPLSQPGRGAVGTDFDFCIFFIFRNFMLGEKNNKFLFLLNLDIASKSIFYELGTSTLKEREL